MNEPIFRNRLFLALGLASALAVGFLATINVSPMSSFVPAAADGSRYTLTLNKPVSVSNDKGYVTTGDGTNLWFWFYNNYDFSNTDRFITLENDGCFGNSSAIHSLKSISISIDYGCVHVYRGYELENYSIEYGSSSEGYVVGDDAVGTIEFTGGAPAYFKVVATAYTRIKSMTINYDCEVATTTDLELTVKAPSVSNGEISTIADSNYLWIGINAGNGWTEQSMTRLGNGDWKIDLEDIPVSATYTCYLKLSASGDGYDVGYNSTSESGYSFYVSEGQDKATIDSVTFAYQPDIVYNVHVTVNFTSDVSASFGNMQFISSLWDYTSGGNYKWGDYFSGTGNVLTFTKEISSDTYDYFANNQCRLYWKLYLWDDSLGNVYYNGSSGANLTIIPDGSSDFYIIVDAAYPTSSSFSGTVMTYTNHQSTSVYGDPVYLYPSDGGTIATYDSYDSSALRVLDDGGIMGLKAGHVAYPVSVTTSKGNQETFHVYVDGDVYASDADLDGMQNSGTAYAESEGWFESHDVDAISGLGTDFYSGVDISSCYALYQNGSVFYNEDGYEQSIFTILADHHVNWVRLRLWVDPQSADEALSYGGGACDLDAVLWMAKEAKFAGLKVLLDFHYSDFWAHPGQQILPKSWADCTSKSALCARIKSYTTETLYAFEDEGCLPDMVQLGNEISSGIYLTEYSGSSSESVGTGDYLGMPSYLTSNASYAYGTKNHADYTDYIKAASEGVDAVDSSIKKVLHFGKGSDASVNAVNNFFSAMPSSYYDYAALSVYAYGYFDNKAGMQSFFNGLSISKPWFIAETAHPYTDGKTIHITSTDDYLSNFIWSSSTGVKSGFVSNYPFSPAGQASFIHDFAKEVYDHDGLGLFYWEPAWSVNKDIGWASTNSRNTQASMGLFSFQGKALGNIDIFDQLLGLA